MSTFNVRGSCRIRYIADPGGISYGIITYNTASIDVQEVRFRGDDTGILDSNSFKLQQTRWICKQTGMTSANDSFNKPVDTDK